jgi:hypothetical protein
MMNNTESKRERTRENQDTDLCGLTISLPLQEFGYILVYDLRLQYNIFITKLYYTNRYKNPKIPVPYSGALPPHTYNLIVPNRPLALQCLANWPLYWYFSITLYAWENMNHLFQQKINFRTKLLHFYISLLLVILLGRVFYNQCK